MSIPVMPDNSGYFDPADVPEPFDPFEPDRYIQWLIYTEQVPVLPK